MSLPLLFRRVNVRGFPFVYVYRLDVRTFVSLSPCTELGLLLADSLFLYMCLTIMRQVSNTHAQSYDCMHSHVCAHTYIHTYARAYRETYRHTNTKLTFTNRNIQTSTDKDIVLNKHKLEFILIIY